MFLVVIARCLRIAFLCNTSGGCFWQSYHGTVKSAGVPVRASTCFWFWSKTFTKRCTNNYLLSRGNSTSFLACVDWLRASDFRMFWKNISCFRFWWKTYTKRCANNYVISHDKNLPSPALCGWSGAFNFWVWFGKRKNNVSAKLLHKKHGHENPDFHFVPLLFILLT